MKSIIFDGSSSIIPKYLSRLFFFISSELNTESLDNLFNLSLINKLNPDCIMSILLIFSSVF